MADQRRLATVPAARGEVEACWMCGIRLPAEQLVADGGSACTDVRWYCRDMRGCTERWTSRARNGGIRPAAAGPSGAVGRPLGVPGAARSG
jgi:hypothetical protein